MKKILRVVRCGNTMDLGVWVCLGYYHMSLGRNFQ